MKKLLLTLFTFITILAHGANDSVRTVTSGDEINGKGTITYANGDKYVGAWQDNKRNGQSTYTWSNGDKYVGEYKDNKLNGQGTWTSVHGSQRTGLWKNDYLPKKGPCDSYNVVLEMHLDSYSKNPGSQLWADAVLEAQKALGECLKYLR